MILSLFVVLWLVGEIPIGKFWRDPEWWRTSAPNWVSALATTFAAVLAWVAIRRWSVQESARRRAELAERLLLAANECLEALKEAYVWREEGWMPEGKEELRRLVSGENEGLWLDVERKLRTMRRVHVAAEHLLDESVWLDVYSIERDASDGVRAFEQLTALATEEFTKTENWLEGVRERVPLVTRTVTKDPANEDLEKTWRQLVSSLRRYTDYTWKEPVE